MYQATAKRPKLDGQQRQRELRLPLPAGDQCRRCGGETEILHGSGKVRCQDCDEVVPYSCGSKARIDATAAETSCSADGSRIDDTAAVCGASGPGVSTAIGSCAIDHGVIAAIWCVPDDSGRGADDAGAKQEYQPGGCTMTPARWTKVMAIQRDTWFSCLRARNGYLSRDLL